MKLISQLERTVRGWLKNVPHLPASARQWIGENAWWIAAVGAVVSGLGALGLLLGVFETLSALNNPYVAYYASSTFVTWVVIKSIVSLVFIAVTSVLLAVAISPLKEKQKKGWVLLFAAWLVSALSVVVSAVLTLNPFGLITNLIFGALWVALGGYFIFEIHGQFAHTERSKGVKSKKAL